MSIYSYITIVSAILFIILVLVQTRGASLGAGLGTGGDVNTTRRGSDKTVHQITIVLAFVFVASIMLEVVS
jgi:preprotein translocase subunit SecG